MIQTDVAIVGGGFTGAVFAIHLSRMARRTLTISVVEPRPVVGHGIAYGTNDPDHRLNGPIDVHMVYPDAPGDLREWFLSGGGLDRDPEAQVSDGAIYIRRSDFGRYVSEQFEAHVARNPSNSAINHCRGQVIDIGKSMGRYELTLKDGGQISTKNVVVAASYEQPASPAVFQGEIARHPGFIGDPWDMARIATIPADAKVLVLGAAQTGSEVVAGLLRRDHRGPITAISRHGLRPRSRPAGALPPSASLTERVNRPCSLFTEDHGRFDTLLELFRTLRRETRKVEQAGGTWAEPFGDLRDSLWEVWPALPLKEKRRFMRHLRRWYDVHRFQLPPQVESCIKASEDIGQVRFRAAAAEVAEVRDGALAVTLRSRGGSGGRPEKFDTVINCTGPAAHPDRSGNPVLRSLIARGFAVPHEAGVGLDIDADNHAIGKNCRPDPRLYVVGPLTYAASADQQSAAFIAVRLQKIMPAFLKGLDL